MAACRIHTDTVCDSSNKPMLEIELNFHNDGYGKQERVKTKNVVIYKSDTCAGCTRQSIYKLLISWGMHSNSPGSEI